MNRLLRGLKFMEGSVPRASGDEPDGASYSMRSSSCSPRQRG